jgi:hypothetical protein
VIKKPKGGKYSKDHTAYEGPERKKRKTRKVQNKY